jgi:hypothetical protein
VGNMKGSDLVKLGNPNLSPSSADVAHALQPVPAVWENLPELCLS